MACTTVLEAPMILPPTGLSPEPLVPAGASADGAVAGALPWWAEAEWDEPTDADLHGCWPDPLAGPPDGEEDSWLGSLCDEQLSALANLDAIADAVRACRLGFQLPSGAGFTHRDGAEPTPGERVTGPGTGFEGGGILDQLAPDPVLADFTLDAFEHVRELSDDQLVGMVQAARRVAAQHNGVELAGLTELDRRRQATATRPGSARVDEHTAEEMAAALVLTGKSADALLWLCRGLARLPMVVKALLAGRIDRARAKVFAEELAGLSDKQAQAIAIAFIGIAGQLTTAQLRAQIRAMVLWLDPKAVRKPAERGARGARVQTWPEGSGEAGMAGRELPPSDVLAGFARLSAIAAALQQAGAPGSMDELRAQVFCALLTGRDPATIFPGSDANGRPNDDEPQNEAPDDTEPSNVGPSDTEPSDTQPSDTEPNNDEANDIGRAATGSGEPGGAGKAGAGKAGAGKARDGKAGPDSGLGSLTGSVNLTVPLATWLRRGGRPGEVAGFGPAGAATCRDLANRLANNPNSKWCVTLTRPDGRAVAHACARAGPGPPVEGSDGGPWLSGLQFEFLERGTCDHQRQSAAYKPPDRLRHLITIRHRTCSFPGCRLQAVRCDLDHTIPFDQGGLTCACNLAPLCRRHHRAKQSEGWHLAQPEPGILTWTLPHGRSYIVQPDAYPV